MSPLADRPTTAMIADLQQANHSSHTPRPYGSKNRAGSPFMPP
jgi:hypothetical protein